MCGYCAEQHAFQIALAQKNGLALQPEQERGYYLQETDQLLHAIHAREEFLKTLFDPQADYKCVNSLQEILCRVLEILIVKGYPSEEYQKLITDKFVLSVISYEAKRPVIADTRLLATHSDLRNWFSADFFIKPHVGENFLNNPSLLENCADLLNAYIDWWHLGITKSDDDFNKKFALFKQAFVYVFFCLIFLSKHCPTHNSIRRLVNTNPNAPDLVALELWLQRMAAIKLYDIAGLEAFLPYGFEISRDRTRPMLIYYLMIHDRLTLSEKRLLKTTIQERLSSYRPGFGDDFRTHNFPLHATVEWVMLEQLQDL